MGYGVFQDVVQFIQDLSYQNRMWESYLRAKTAEDISNAQETLYNNPTL